MNQELEMTAPVYSLLRPYLDKSIFGKLDGVTDQVGEDLFDPEGVKTDDLGD